VLGIAAPQPGTIIYYAKGWDKTLVLRKYGNLKEETLKET
jgi:hypothetical protein